MNDIEKLFNHDCDLITPPADITDEAVASNEAVQIIPNSEYFERYLAECYNTVLTSKEININQTPCHNGAMEFRKALATFMFRLRNIEVNPELVIVGSGLQSLLSNILRLPSIMHPEGILRQEGLLSRAEQIATGVRPMVAIAEDEDEQIKKMFSTSRIKIKDVAVDEQGVSFNSLISSGSTLLYVSPRDVPNFYLEDPEERRRDLLDWANSASYRFIIEYDSTKRIQSVPTFKKFDEKDDVIYLNSFSSLLCNGISASWAVLPEKLYKEYSEMFNNFPCQLSYLEQKALAMFTEKGYLDNYLESIQSSIDEEAQEDELAF
ncbi:MAG: hypothetical protein K6G00_02190 [Treponema sp.]|nr:hypothetical protein [Treponema sp.]